MVVANYPGNKTSQKSATEKWFSLYSLPESETPIFTDT